MKTAKTDVEVAEKVNAFKRTLRDKIDEEPGTSTVHRKVALSFGDLAYLEQQIDFLLAAHFRGTA